MCRPNSKASTARSCPIISFRGSSSLVSSNPSCAGSTVGDSMETGILNLLTVIVAPSRLLKKSASFVLASLRGSTYRSVRFASSLAAALLGGLFEQPTGFARTVCTSPSPVLPRLQNSFQYPATGRWGTDGEPLTPEDPSHPLQC